MEFLRGTACQEAARAGSLQGKVSWKLSTPTQPAGQKSHQSHSPPGEPSKAGPVGLARIRHSPVNTRQVPGDKAGLGPSWKSSPSQGLGPSNGSKAWDRHDCNSAEALAQMGARWKELGLKAGPTGTGVSPGCVQGQQRRGAALSPASSRLALSPDSRTARRGHALRALRQGPHLSVCPC